MNAACKSLIDHVSIDRMKPSIGQGVFCCGAGPCTSRQFRIRVVLMQCDSSHGPRSANQGARGKWPTTERWIVGRTILAIGRMAFRLPGGQGQWQARSRFVRRGGPFEAFLLARKGTAHPPPSQAEGATLSGVVWRARRFRIATGIEARLNFHQACIPALPCGLTAGFGPPTERRSVVLAPTVAVDTAPGRRFLRPRDGFDWRLPGSGDGRWEGGTRVRLSRACARHALHSCGARPAERSAFASSRRPLYRLRRIAPMQRLPDLLQVIGAPEPGENSRERRHAERPRR